MPGLSLIKFLHWAITRQYDREGNARIKKTFQHPADGNARLSIRRSYAKAGNCRLMVPFQYAKVGNAKIRIPPYPRSTRAILTDVIGAELIKPELDAISTGKKEVLSADEVKPHIDKAGREGF